MKTSNTIRFLTIAVLVLWSLGGFSAAAERAASTFLTGNKFRHELDQPLTAVFRQTDLRQIMNQLSVDRQISIVLDRRLDTSLEFPLTLKNVSVQSGLTQIAQIAKGDLVVLDSLIFFGPKSSTSRLRTLIELRKTELSLKQTGIPERRRPDLLRRQSFAWQELDEPQQILESITGPVRLRVTNPDLVPHDLWAAKTLPDVSPIEALSIVLIQFDLTFEWKNAGSSIELVPIPDRIWVERKFHPKQKLSEAISTIHERFPDLDVQTLNTEIVVKGLVEECESVGDLLRGTKPDRPNKPEIAQDLRKQRFTFSTPIPVPLSAIIKKLEESDIQFEYDAEEFKEHGIDLEQLVQIDVKNESAESFFKTLFGSARVDFQIDRSTVKLTPKKRK